MTVIQAHGFDTSRVEPAGVRVAADTAGLDQIAREDTAALICLRPLDPAMLAWLAALDPELLPTLRTVVKPDAVADVAAAAFREAGTPQNAHCAALVSDIAALCGAMATLMEAPFVRLRVQAVTNNACRKFHTDVVTARLVCTYRGAGTQYGTAIADDDPVEIHEVPTGAPIILRGLDWPETPPSGLRHRSPPIEGTGETRLVLVIDPISECEDEIPR